jgi:flagellar FliJ protein
MKATVLDKLVEQARRVRDDAAGAAAAAVREVDQAQRTFDLLTGYLSEHLQRAPFDKSVSPALLPVREGFTRKLDLAITEQTRQRDGLRQTADARQLELVERQRRLLAYETLMERRAAARQKTQHRADQRNTDELAAQVTRARKGAVRRDS